MHLTYHFPKKNGGINHCRKCCLCT